MLSNELCEALLSISRPWKIRQIKADGTQQRLIVDVSLEGARRGLFSRERRGECPSCGRSFPVSKEAKQLMLRHINLGTYQVYLRFPPPAVTCGRTNDACPLRLEAAPTMRFTQDLRRQIQPFWDSDQGSGIVCRLLDLAPTEVAQLRKSSVLAPPSTESGAPTSTERTAAPGASAPSRVSESQASPGRGTDLPPVTHPVWRGLIDRTITLKTNNFALQMLLTWAGAQGNDDAIESMRLSKISMLRAYFEKHRQDLEAEIGQLFGSGEST